ncbi:hypothetical protein [Herbaspirillum huttiense]|uniref:hypothetical protein n=1 Tax=Herbaspirillum huttiense TaxID=863372 RepID=UPI0039AEB033
MNSKLYSLTTIDGSQSTILGPSGKAKSVLEFLTQKEQEELSDWSAIQASDGGRGCSIDLMRWPGWKGVMARRLREISKADGLLVP